MFFFDMDPEAWLAEFPRMRRWLDRREARRGPHEDFIAQQEDMSRVATDLERAVVKAAASKPAC